MTTWRPPADTTTLVEPLDPEPGYEALTATVLDDDRLLLDLGASPKPPTPIDVVANFFTPNALLRATGVLVALEDEETTVFELVVKDVEHIQRRHAKRKFVELKASMVVADGPGPMISVVGLTQDVSAGGCRVVADQPLGGTKPVITLEVPGAPPVVAQATVLSRLHSGDVWDYRLMFTAIDEEDRARLERLTA